MTDAHLTELGIKQAKDLNTFWADGLKNLKIPAPEKYFTSPLARCLETAKLTFSGLDLPADRPFKPMVKELMRERLGVNTCDRRSSRSWIQENYPDYDIEPDFSEEDQFWNPYVRETQEVHTARTRTLLDDIFSNEKSVFVSFTTHSGSVRALFEAVGQQETWVTTGCVVAVLVKAERVMEN